jgi:hypothetical protein
VKNELGVFVASFGKPGAAGTKEEPVSTIEEALALGAESGKRIYACAESFDEPPLVSAVGLTIFGGLDCKKDWAWIGDEQKTRVRVDGGGVALHLSGGTARIDDVALEAIAPASPGSSSIALVVEKATATLTRCEVTAGDASDGIPGADASSSPAAAGPKGNDGKAYAGCVPKIGGAEIANPACPVSVGGKGGDGGDYSHGTLNGFPGDAGTVGTAGHGGLGQATDLWTCAVGAGEDGSLGAPGLIGSGGKRLGSLTAAGYRGADGEMGAAGAPGQGGGGGGGAKQTQSCVGGTPFGAPSGGGGGAGGCGGLGGGGGKAAGSSIAVVSIEASLSFDTVRLVSGRGGAGGRGGKGQVGGAGGLGGIGGDNNDLLVASACNGGKGGRGGDGGIGGGGSGGHSLCLGFVGMSPPRSGFTCAFGAAGYGGPGGGGDSSTGAPGVAAEMQEF